MGGRLKGIQTRTGCTQLGRLKIAYDCHLLYSSGIGTQTRGLLTGWAALKARGEEEVPEFTFIGNSSDMERFPLLMQMGQLRPYNLPVHSWRWRFFYPRVPGASGTHLLNYDVPAYRWKRPYVVTAHDLTPFVHPEFAPAGFHPHIYGNAIRRTLHNARHVMTPSQHSADDLTLIMDVDPAKITIVPNAVDPQWQRVSENAVAEMRRQMSLPDRYTLAVGINMPHKNYRWLIESYSTWKGARDLPLVIAGALPTPQFQIEDFIRECGNGTVRSLGYISHENLVALYQGAVALVFPTLYEGFGIPVIEAQKLRVPVVCSRSTCLPAVGADGALYFDPHSAAELHEALNRVLEPAVCDRLINAGALNEEKYSWERSARLTSHVYQSSFS